MTEAEIVDELAKSFAEFDGHIIVNEGHPMQLGAWKVYKEPGQDWPHKTREDYEQEARRFLHGFEAARNLLDKLT